MATEVWKVIPGWDGYYEASNQGRIRSVDRYVRVGLSSVRRARGKIRKQVLATRKDDVKYWTVTFSRNNHVSCHYVHRLIALTFLGPCPPGQEIRHGGKGTDVNCISNLSYGTHAQNEADKIRDSKTYWRKVRNSQGQTFMSMTQAAIKLGIKLSHIWDVCNGRRKTAGGFQWEYI